MGPLIVYVVANLLLYQPGKIIIGLLLFGLQPVRLVTIHMFK